VRAATRQLSLTSAVERNVACNLPGSVCAERQCPPVRLGASQCCTDGDDDVHHQLFTAMRVRGLKKIDGKARAVPCIIARALPIDVPALPHTAD
jgi:hypothetical protein